MRRKQIIDPTGTPLTPSFHGRKCLGNGEHPDYEICCENCDYYLRCFPKYRWWIRKLMFKRRIKKLFKIK